MNFNQKSYFGLCVILLLTVVLYLPSLQNSFTNWDDDIHITDNALVQNLTLETLPQYFLPTSAYMYHPVTLLMYGMEWKFGNGNPIVFHAVSLLVHCINIILVFIFLMLLFRRTGIALFVSLFFAILPMNVEAVAWISGRKDELALLFLLLGSIQYLQFPSLSVSRFGYASIYVFFILGLLSKPTVIIFPFLLLLFDWYMHKRLSVQNFISKLPFILLSILFGVFVIIVSSSEVSASIENYSFIQRIQLMSYALLFYPAKILVPYHLSACYSYPDLSGEQIPLLISVAPLFVLSVMGLTYFIRKNTVFIFGALFALLPLLLVLHVVPFHNASLVADRYGYISSVGILIAIAALIHSTFNTHFIQSIFMRGLFAVVFFAVVLFNMRIAFLRTFVWKDGVTLFSDVISKNRYIPLAYGNRADALLKIGKYQDALTNANILLHLDPNNGKAYYIRGNIFSLVEKDDKAIHDYAKALSLQYSSPALLYNLGNALYKTGDRDSAIACYKQSLRKDSLNADTWYSLGVTYNALQQKDIAEKCFLKTVALQPKLISAHYYLAQLYFQKQKWHNALEELALVKMAAPNDVDESMVRSVNKKLQEEHH